MKKFLFSVVIVMIGKVGLAQTQSIVVQKNALPDAGTSFSFSASGPGGTTIPASFNLVDNGGGVGAVDIGASSSGTGFLAFAEDGNGAQGYTYASGAANWVEDAPSSNVVKVDVETGGTYWQINTSNNIFRGSTFEGTALDVGVGPDNGVYIVGTDSKLYKWNGSPSSFTALAGNPSGNRIDGGPSGTAWFVDSGIYNHVFEYNGSTSIDHGLSPEGKNFVDIAVGADGKAWAIADAASSPGGGNYKLLFYWNGSAWIRDALAPIGTNMFGVTVGADNEPLITLSFNGSRKFILKRLSDGRWVKIDPQTSNNNSIIFYNQPTGNYTFTEAVAGGYYLQDIIIFGTTGDGYSTSTGTVNVNLGANEHAYVQYTNVNGSKPAATSIGSSCGSTFVEDFGTGTVHASVPLGQTFNAYQSGHDVNDGFYTLTDSVANAKGDGYSWITGATDHDHTGNANGRMFLVNADFSAGVFYEKEYTSLVVGNSYEFSAWVANVLLNSATFSTDPNVILRVVDPNTGAILLDLTTGDIAKSAGNTLDWKNFKGSFIATGNTVKVYLINNKPGGDGNDLVLDDIAFTATCQTLSGAIFNDANGVRDAAVNGIGTSTASPLYVVLVDADNKIVASSTLPSNGTYSFSNLFADTYSVKITTQVPGVIGTTAPNASLTPNWLNTGNNLGSNNGVGAGLLTTGNLDSIRVIVGTTSVTNVDFGIERAPIANDVTASSQVNPGGTNKIVVPTLNGTDPEQGSLPGTGNLDTVVIRTLPTNGTLYYNSVPVAAGDTIKNYNPALLTVDPNDGAITVTFTYSEIDAALVGSTPATVNIPLTTLSISGNVFNDANGLADGIVNGIGVNGADIDAVASGSQTLYAQLLTGADNVIATAPIQSDGSYSFPGLNAGTYKVVINQTPGGSPSSTAGVPAGWIFTGDNIGTGVGNDGTKDGVLSNIVLSTTNVSNVNFGIEQPPTAKNETAPDQVNPGGTNTVVVPTLNGTDPEQGILPGTGNADTVVIKSLPTNGTLYYNSIPVVLGDTIRNYNPSLLTVDPNDGILTVVFTYSEIDAALVGSPAATVSIPFTTVLPIRLADFVAKTTINEVNLNWIVTSEINTNLYTVERSTNNIDFTSIGILNATGNATTTSVYHFSDALPIDGVNFYRLKIVDKDGNVTYSKIVTAKIDKTNLQIATSPNPFVNAVKVKMNLPKANVVKINMVDAIGRVVYQKTFKGIQGTNQISLDGLDKLSSGVYIINIKTDNIIAQQKLIKKS